VVLPAPRKPPMSRKCLCVLSSELISANLTNKTCHAPPVSRCDLIRKKRRCKTLRNQQDGPGDHSSSGVPLQVWVPRVR
jgi:hypothetical protein